MYMHNTQHRRLSVYSAHCSYVCMINPAGHCIPLYIAGRGGSTSRLWPLRVGTEMSSPLLSQSMLLLYGEHHTGRSAPLQPSGVAPTPQASVARSYCECGMANPQGPSAFPSPTPVPSSPPRPGSIQERLIAKQTLLLDAQCIDAKLSDVGVAGSTDGGSLFQGRL